MEAPLSPTAQLLEQGYTVLSLPEGPTAECVNAFRQYLGEIPELKPDCRRAPDGTRDYSAGSFGALNFASAFHCPAACKIDEVITENLCPVFEDVARSGGWGFWELIPDRLCYRTKPQPRESWHTDNTAGAVTTNEFYVLVVVNLSVDKDRVFTCVPGTHSLSARLEGGYFTPEADQAQWAAREVQVHIPPGHVMLVAENIVHRITGDRKYLPAMNKFSGIRFSNEALQWCPENIGRMERQEPLIHKGGQVAPLYPKLWLTNWPHKLQAYADELDPRLVEPYTYKTGFKKGRSIRKPVAEPLGLCELGTPYPLTERDRKRFAPHAVLLSEPDAKRPRLAHN